MGGSSMSDLAATIQDKRFTSVHLREGYDIHEVDAFLDALVEAATAGRPLAPLCAAAQFAAVRLREGYDMDEVDTFLDEVGAAAPDPSAAPPPTPSVPTVDQPDPAPVEPAQSVEPARPVETPQPSVIEEQRGLLGRLFGRR
jgi:DivIVA domain-containing protein